MKCYVTFIFVILITIQYCISQDNKFTGYATAIVNQDGIENIEVFGFADKLKNKKYSEQTIQPIASVSKTFIGISLMIAYEKGLVDLDRDINEYLDFSVKNPHVKESNVITLRHLATHTSGIIDNEKIYESAYYAYHSQPKKSLKSFLFQHLNNIPKNVKKSFSKNKAGTYYEYSNIGAALAAYVLERASNKPFYEFTKEHIFTPLGMKNTGWFYEDIDGSKHSVLYDEKDKPVPPYACETYPDGSLKTNIQDLSLYLIELIKGYNGNSSLLTKESWASLYKKQFDQNNTVEGINPREPNSGIFMPYFKSGKIGHTGSDWGVSTFLTFNPKTGMGQIFMANEDLTQDNLQTFKDIWNTLGK